MIAHRAQVAIYKLHFTFSGALMSHLTLNPNPTLKSKLSGRYDKLHAADMATRFVKGTCENPNGLPNDLTGIKHADIERFVQVLIFRHVNSMITS